MPSYETTTGPMQGSIRPTSAIDEANIAFESATRLATRVKLLADRLLGPVPEADESRNSSVPAGVLGELGARAEYVQALIGEAESAMSRIERALP